MWTIKQRELFDMLEPVAQSVGLTIVELDVPLGQNGILRIYVECLDADKKVTVDDCAKFSPVVSDYLDTTEMFNFRYYLEISSPGLDRPIRRFDQLERFIGEKIRVSFIGRFDGRKHLTGTLDSVNQDAGSFVVLENNIPVTVDKVAVRKINIVWEGDK